jgi:cytochrome b pre-mRNA-processing protein 3
MFFTEFGVPDTVDGRFELICLHAFLYLHRLKSERPRSEAVSQAFFDAMFTDMDRGLREMGTGDLSVGRHVKRMAQGFYGRIRAYQDGLEGGDTVLAGALARNLFGTVRESPERIAAVAAYMRSAAELLARQPAAELAAGNPHFPSPGLAAPDTARGAYAASR